jgi:hypothetical protein
MGFSLYLYIYIMVKTNNIKIKIKYIYIYIYKLQKLIVLKSNQNQFKTLIYFIAKTHRTAPFYLNRKHSSMSAPKANRMAPSSPNRKLSLMSSVTENA